METEIFHDPQKNNPQGNQNWNQSIPGNLKWDFTPVPAIDLSWLRFLSLLHCLLVLPMVNYQFFLSTISIFSSPHSSWFPIISACHELSWPTLSWSRPGIGKLWPVGQICFAFVNKAHSFTIVWGLCWLQRQSWVVTTETMWSTKAIWLFRDSFLIPGLVACL